MIEVREFLEAVTQPSQVDVYELVDPDEFDFRWENLYEQAMTLFENCYFPTEDTFIDELVGLDEYRNLVGVWTQINGPWREAYEYAYGKSDREYPHTFYDAFRNALRGTAVLAIGDQTGRARQIIYKSVGKTPAQILEII